MNMQTPILKQCKKPYSQWCLMPKRKADTTKTGKYLEPTVWLCCQFLKLSLSFSSPKTQCSGGKHCLLK